MQAPCQLTRCSQLPHCTLRWAVLAFATLLCTVAYGAVNDPSAPHRSASGYDVVVYGGTSAGVIAAVQTARMGKSVVLIEPGRHVGGLSREFYRRVKAWYARDAAWIQETREEHFAGGNRNRGGEDAMWTFEPRIAEAIYRDMLREANVPIVFGERLDLTSAIEKDGATIVAITMDSGRVFRGRMFIDATYEGDLLAKAGVTYTIGREANARYGETLNGVQPALNVKNHRFLVRVDPYVTPGDPASGLLPGIQPQLAPAGSGDERVQAYCFRMCQTDVKENQAEWARPAGYDPLRYELLLRNFEAGDERVPWSPTAMPNRKTDTNNNCAVSTDNIGMNYAWPDGDYQARERIFQEHLAYQQGLMWTLANHPRVPERVRQVFQTWKPARDEFTDHGHWPHQLYVREARRMVSDYVMTQHNCQGRATVDDSVGLAAYGMDSHNIQRYLAADGSVQNEGDVQVHGFSPYPIAYRSICPKASECANLLAPVCVSSSHIAYGSIRMEPVFMVLGQSAATAACQAIDQQAAVQDIDFAMLRERLLADAQVLEWTGPRRTPPIDPKSLPGIVLDEGDAELIGAWQGSRSIDGYVGEQYLHDGDAAKGELKAVFRPKFPRAGRYDVRIAYTPNANRATNVPVEVVAAEGAKTARLNQRKRPEHGAFESVGTFRFDAGQSGAVTISTAGTDGHVIVDAVQFVPGE